MRASFRLVLTVVALGLLLASCAKATPTPAPTKTPTPAPVGTPTPAPMKAMTIKLYTFWPATGTYTACLNKWADEVTARTGGAIQFERFYGGVLGEPKDQLDNIKAGVFAVGPTHPGH